MTVGNVDRARISWAKPVAIRIGYGSSELVRGPEEACDYLTRRWPTSEGTYYGVALRKCTAAIDRRVPAEEARELFISAAIEAYVLA